MFEAGTKTRVARRYVATWYINVEGVQSNMISEYMDAVKGSLSDSHEDPFDELREAFEAPVCGYWVPTKHDRTHLEIQEFTFTEEEEEIDYDEEI